MRPTPSSERNSADEPFLNYAAHEQFLDDRMEYSYNDRQSHKKAQRLQLYWVLSTAFFFATTLICLLKIFSDNSCCHSKFGSFEEGFKSDLGRCISLCGMKGFV
jgi:hypothetical protein